MASRTFAPELALRALEQLTQSLPSLNEFADSFISNLGNLLIVSPPMLEALRAHPAWIEWLAKRDQLARLGNDLFPSFDAEWERWSVESGARLDYMESLRAFSRRQVLEIAYFDASGLFFFGDTVCRLSALADWVIASALRFSWLSLTSAQDDPTGRPDVPEGFAIFALGKLGAEELNYSSDVDLVFFRRSSGSEDDLRFYTRLGERLLRVLSQIGSEGLLYRVDMRLRPYGATGPLVPTVDSMVNYYESWGEAWERQALIKARFVTGSEDLGRRFGDFVSHFVFARQMDDSSLEEIKRVKHRSETEYALPEDRFDVKQGRGGIRDIEFYVQYLQLIAGGTHPEVRARSTLDALARLGQAKVLLAGEESHLSLAYLFLRTVEHRLHMRAFTPRTVIPNTDEELSLLAQTLGFRGEQNPADQFRAILGHYRSRVRGILERIYLTLGHLRLTEPEEEFAQLLTERTPEARVRDLLSNYGFQDIEKAWQNIRLLGLGPAGRLLPPGQRRAFLEFVFPLLDVLRDSIDPDEALHHLESFASASGNRVSFLRTLASRRPHLSRLANLLALSNLAQQILSRHPEYFDSLAHGIHLDQSRGSQDMYVEMLERLKAPHSVESAENVIRKFHQRETIRIAYRDLGGLASPLEVSRELSELAEACIHVAVDQAHQPTTEFPELQVIALGKLGSRQMHYASDLDLMFLYQSAREEASPKERANLQQVQDRRVERTVEILAGMTLEGTAYSVDLRLRPEGTSGFLARSWEAFLDYSRQYMQPWERLAMVRSRILFDDGTRSKQWDAVVSEMVYEFPWNEESLEAIRHLKRRIEAEKNRESRINIDFKFGKGGIVDLEFLVQFLQILHGRRHVGARAPEIIVALPALCAAGALSSSEQDKILAAHQFQRRVENRYQLLEEWNSREISRESPLLIRMARSLGYRADSPSATRKAFLADWDDNAQVVRQFVERYFFGK